MALLATNLVIDIIAITINFQLATLKHKQIDCFFWKKGRKLQFSEFYPVVMENKKNRPIFKDQPITCPYVSSQPWNVFLSPPCGIQRFLSRPPAFHTVSPQLMRSSNHFYHFTRLMQLFPDTHPATIHTVLILCNFNFLGAVDKLLYAKSCKMHSLKENLLAGASSSLAKAEGACEMTKAEKGRYEENKENHADNEGLVSNSHLDAASSDFTKPGEIIDEENAINLSVQ